MNEKTVYILGAGFSAAAGAPSQASLVQKILALPKSGKNPLLIDWVNKFKAFLQSSLAVNGKFFKDYSLEDLFTPIDMCISAAIPFREHSVKDLMELKNIFNNLIILALREGTRSAHMKKNPDSAFIDSFAKHLVNLCKDRISNQQLDPVSVITTNWDILLDNKLHNFINSAASKNKFGFGVVDYCCHISSLDKVDKSVIPGLQVLGMGGYNVKLLKLHGSTNWLQCQMCQRLYVKFYKASNGGFVYKPLYCRHCSSHFRMSESESIKLVPNLVTPTFLKNLNNVQNKVVWQNAGVELSEASKVVFIGYSLPLADYEFKHLLSSMIRRDAKIEVVLRENDECPSNNLGFRNNYAGYRYRTFFSGRNLKILYSGAAAYLAKL